MVTFRDGSSNSIYGLAFLKVLALQLNSGQHSGQPSFDLQYFFFWGGGNIYQQFFTTQLSKNYSIKRFTESYSSLHILQGLVAGCNSFCLFFIFLITYIHSFHIHTIHLSIAICWGLSGDWLQTAYSCQPNTFLPSFTTSMKLLPQQGLQRKTNTCQYGCILFKCTKA